jgi:hypothetical protein
VAVPQPGRPEAGVASPHRARGWRALRHRLFPIAVAAGALLLFVWPLLRAPPLSLGQAWGHLTTTWFLLIVTLVAMGYALDGGALDEEDVD